ncbi:MAG: zinc-ribbon domain-containing protein [Candidatus Bathyarchaeota archaeon]|nr:zinc-ribbon domain-containing protein [Candidatus Bathyarchaeota archaeon]
MFPELAEEWHPTKNGDLKPAQVTPGSGIKVWWKCSKRGHGWEAVTKERTRGTGCPFCNRERRRSRN